MSAYQGSSLFDQSVEKATPDRNTEPDWALILEICDKVGQSSNGPTDCLKAIMKRLEKGTKNTQLCTLTLLDSCVMNCGSSFHKAVATPDFVKEARAFLAKASSETADKFKELLKKWAENEFKKDSSLSAIPSFYQNLRKEGAYFGMGGSSTGTSQLSTSSSDGSSDLEKAIALSLKESQPKSTSSVASSSLYPQMAMTPATSNGPSNHIGGTVTTAPSSGEKQARALYDFEAVEENELTFKSGEMITVTDDSDVNWWKGRTWRGEGLFPANFVTTDLSLPSADEVPAKKGVSFNEEVVVEQFDPDNVKIDEGVIDRALDQIQNADPTGMTEDSGEMLNLEEECKAMVPLIDGELEQVDKKHNELMSLNKKLIDSFQMYTKLMAESAAVPQYSAPSSYMAPSTQPAAAMTNHMLPQMTSQQPAYQSLPAAGSYVPDPSTAQRYYSYGGYNGQAMAAAQMPTEPVRSDAAAMPISQSDMLQQYQMNSASLGSLPSYIPNTSSASGMHAGYNSPYPAAPPAQQLL